MGRELVTRRVLARELAINAATRPLNLAIPAGVVGGGVLLQVMWLLPVALVVYVAMAIATFFDGDEAERVSRRAYERARPASRSELDLSLFTPSIARKLELARAEEARIRQAIEAAPVPRYDVTDEVARLLMGMEKLAQRAQQIHTYLSEQDEQGVRDRLHRLRAAKSGDHAVDEANAEAATALEEQLAAMAHLERQLSRFDAQMEHAAASLGAIHGQIVRMNATEEAATQEDVAAEVRNLRREMNTAADAMRETYDELSSGRN
jgi:cytochrome c-type biogenesis protein CcmH/NrfF